MKKIEQQTIASYTYLWNKEIRQERHIHKTHFEVVQSMLDSPIVQKGTGMEIGCGPGRDMEFMARAYPENKFIAVDFNCSILEVAKKLRPLKNVFFVRASALALPFKDGKADFVYSFGVLHHTVDPAKGISEINRVLKDKGTATLYLYENHEDNRIKFYSLKAVTFLRRLTIQLPPRVLYSFCAVLSPFIYLLFSVPAGLLGKRGKTKGLADKIPFNFGKHPFDLVGDLFDRFGTPIEVRYGREELGGTMRSEKFHNVILKKIPDTAGWVVWAAKNGVGE